MIQVKRAYEPPARNDGHRFLVDHLWPRGIKKGTLKVEGWVKAVSPSNELRRWFRHDPAKWKEFQRRYASELDKKPASWKPLLQAAKAGDVTLVFGARDEEHNDAVVLREILLRPLRGRS